MGIRNPIFSTAMYIDMVWNVASYFNKKVHMKGWQFGIKLLTLQKYILVFAPMNKVLNLYKSGELFLFHTSNLYFSTSKKNGPAIYEILLVIHSHTTTKFPTTS